MTLKEIKFSNKDLFIYLFIFKMKFAIIVSLILPVCTAFTIRDGNTYNFLTIIILIHFILVMRASVTDKLYTFEKSAKIFAEAKV